MAARGGWSSRCRGSGGQTGGATAATGDSGGAACGRLAAFSSYEVPCASLTLVICNEGRVGIAHICWKTVQLAHYQALPRNPSRGGNKTVKGRNVRSSEEQSVRSGGGGGVCACLCVCVGGGGGQRPGGWRGCAYVCATCVCALLVCVRFDYRPAPLPRHATLACWESPAGMVSCCAAESCISSSVSSAGRQ
jgi:hypothetical protein